MNIRLGMAVGLAMCFNSFAFSQCEVIGSAQCVEFAGMFGYPNNIDACTETPCDPVGEGDFNCPGGEAYSYHNNSTDYHYSGEGGSKSVSYALGSPCVQKRTCGNCMTPTTERPEPGCLFAANTVWTDFLWGTNISPEGGPCGEEEDEEEDEEVGGD